MSDYFTVKRLVSTVRRIMNDKIQPYFVEDEDLVDFINLRGREVAERASVLFKSTATVTVKAGDPWITRPDLVCTPRVLVGQSDQRILTPLAYDAAANQCYSDYGLHCNGTLSKWRTRTGNPEYFIPDMEEGRWRIMPYLDPDVDEQVYNVEGYYYPDPISCLEDNLELPDRVMTHLHLGVLASCFGIEDADAIYDPKKEGEYEARWEQAIADLTHRERRDNRGGGSNVRYGGYP